MLRLSLRNVLGPQAPLRDDDLRRRPGRRLRRRLLRRHRLLPPVRRPALPDITAGIDVSVRAETEPRERRRHRRRRGRVPVSLVDTVRDVDGVAAAEGAVGGYAQLVDLDGDR